MTVADAAGSILGFLNVGYTEKTTAAEGSFDDVAMPATAAELVFQGYLRDVPLDMSSDFTGTWLGRRIADANYYYALDALASTYLSVRLGNIGAQQNSKVPELLRSKAEALQQIARNGIQNFEKWCASEAAVHGANYMASISALSGLSDHAADGLSEAEDYWTKNAADFSFSMPSAPDDWGYIIAYGGYGYALKNTAMQMLSRKPGFADARNPAISQYYQQAGQSLHEIATKIIELYEQFTLAQKIQLAVARAQI